MAFSRRFLDLINFVVCIVAIFLKNLLQEYLYQKWAVAAWDIVPSGVFQAVFETFDWLLFWVYFNKALKSKLQIAFMFVLTAAFTTIPDFMAEPLVGLDNDNLALKAFCYFVPFLVFILIKKKPEQIFLPVLMAFIPWVNLEIANGFDGNISFLQVLFSQDFLVQEFSEGIYLNMGLALAKAFFWGVFSVLFFEISHQFFALKSWRLYVEMTLQKRYLLLIFVLFKAIIYWLIGSLIIALLGNNLMPLFTNLVGLGFNLIGFVGFLVICTLYFRKYMTLYFYDKCGHSNWLYPFFFLPFVDLVALFIFMLFPARHIKRFFGFKYSKELLVGLVGALLLGYAAVVYFQQIRLIPENEATVKRALTLAQVVFPIATAIGVWFSLKKVWVYRSLMLFLFILFPVYFLYVVPQVENYLKIDHLVRILSLYLNTALSIGFLYPVLNFKSFLKLN